MKKSKRKDGIRYDGYFIRPRTSGWFMVDFNRDGNRVRKCLSSLAEAKAYIDGKANEAKKKGRLAFGIDDQDRLDLVDLRKQIAPAIRLSEIADFWVKHHPSGVQITIEALVDDFTAKTTMGRRGKKIVERREATRLGHGKRLKSFVEAFGTRNAFEVTQQDVDQWLDQRSGGALNRRHYLATVRALFNHGVRKGAVGTNPAEAIAMPEGKIEAPIILTVAQVKKYLNAIERECPEMLPREAIAFFAGLRPEELSRLDWQNVSIENKLITVSGDVAKVQGHRRHVEMPDNLVRWLAPYARAGGPVWPYASPTTLHLKRAEARKASHVKVPDNAGRHAFASYHLAMHENAPKTAEAMGHADVDLLKNVYRNITASNGRPITKTVATDYFTIVPKEETKIVQLRAAG